MSLCGLGAVELARRIRAKEISARDAVGAHLTQIERVNPGLNAIVTLVADRAMECARIADEAQARGERLGPLHGLPIAHKDLQLTNGIRTTFGSPVYKDFVPAEDALAVDYCARVTRQHGEEIELLGGQVHFVALDGHAMGSQVDPHRTGYELVGCLGSCTAASCDRANPRDELAKAEWLHEVVVRSELETDDTVDLLTEGGNDDDRNVGARTKLPANGEAVDIGQPEIEQHEIRRVGGKRSRTRARPHHVEPFAPQPFRERVSDRVVVFHKQHTHRHIVPMRRPGRIGD